METGNDLVSEADTKENFKKKQLMTVSPEVKLQGQTGGNDSSAKSHKSV